MTSCSVSMKIPSSGSMSSVIWLMGSPVSSQREVLAVPHALHHGRLLTALEAGRVLDFRTVIAEEPAHGHGAGGVPRVAGEALEQVVGEHAVALVLEGARDLRGGGGGEEHDPVV